MSDGWQDDKASFVGDVAPQGNITHNKGMYHTAVG
jgi:hypothetical protein